MQMKIKIIYILSLLLIINLFVGNNVVKANEDVDVGIIITNGNEETKKIALTFDDGPDIDFTPQVLRILQKYGIKATFYVIGQKAENNPEIIKKQYDLGHEIGNHTYSHINIAEKTKEETER